MSKTSIRIASYNLQKCVGLDLRRRPDRILAVIERLQADIVVLQEADKRVAPRPAALPYDMVEHHGWRVVPFGTVGGSLGWHGNAMLIRPQITFVKTTHLDLPGLEPRGAICADFQTPIGDIRVLGLHLGLIRRYRLLQVAAISRALKNMAPMPTLWAGDFNEWGALRALDVAAQDVTFLPSVKSFPAPRPIVALDRFALSCDLVSTDHGHHIAHPARIASDHLPVWADIARA